MPFAKKESKQTTCCYVMLSQTEISLNLSDNVNVKPAMLALVRTHSGATCKGVLQLEVTFIEVKNMYLHRDSNLGLWNTVPIKYLRSLVVRALERYSESKDLGSRSGGDTCFSLGGRPCKWLQNES